MEWSGRRTGQDTGSRVSKNGDHSRRNGDQVLLLQQQTIFSTHTKSSLAHIDKENDAGRK